MPSAKKSTTINPSDLLERLDPKKIGIEVKINELPTDKLLSVDIEHDENGNFVCCGFYSPGGVAAYIVFDYSLLLRLIWSDKQLIGHNIRGDIELLRQWGCDIKDEQIKHDTLLYAHILDSSLPEYGLKSLANRFLSIDYPDYDEIVGKHLNKSTKRPACKRDHTCQCPRVTLDKQPQELVAKYNAYDVYVTARLYELQSTELNPTVETYFRDLEMPCSFIFGSMENRGTRIAIEYLRRLRVQLEEQIEPLKEEVQKELGEINLDSPKQLLEALKSKGIRPVWRKKQSTDKRALESVKYIPTVQKLLSYRELETLLSSFVYPYSERGTEYVHPFFNQTGTRTGRPSCSNPNLLQIPKKTNNGKLVRQMFIPRDGMQYGDCDFGQIEPRVLAHLSKDESLCQMFNDGTDFHDFTATKLNINRDRAKVLNLSVGYRATWKSVSQQLNCNKYSAEKQIDQWWTLFPRLRRWEESVIWEAKKTGYVTTLLGRRIKVDGLTDHNQWRREAAERQAINNVAQGSAAEIMKKAMIKISRNPAYSASFGLLVQIYDELLAESFQMEQDLELMKTDMETCIQLDVPLVVKANRGANWGEFK